MAASFSHGAAIASRRKWTLCWTLWRAVSTTTCSRFHGWYSRDTISSQMGNFNPGISGLRASARFRCSLTSEQIISISTTLAAERRATATQASRVTVKGLTESANHGSADAKIVRGDHIRQLIPRVVHRMAKGAAISQRLLDRVNSEVHRAKLTRQFAGDRGLPGSRQPAKYNQHPELSPCYREVVLMRSLHEKEETSPHLFEYGYTWRVRVAG